MIVSLRRRPMFNPIRFVATDTMKGIELPGWSLRVYRPLELRRHTRRAK